MNCEANTACLIAIVSVCNEGQLKKNSQTQKNMPIFSLASEKHPYTMIRINGVDISNTTPNHSTWPLHTLIRLLSLKQRWCAYI